MLISDPSDEFFFIAKTVVSKTYLYLEAIAIFQIPPHEDLDKYNKDKNIYEAVPPLSDAKFITHVRSTILKYDIGIWH